MLFATFLLSLFLRDIFDNYLTIICTSELDIKFYCQKLTKIPMGKSQTKILDLSKEEMQPRSISSLLIFCLTNSSHAPTSKLQWNIFLILILLVVFKPPVRPHLIILQPLLHCRCRFCCLNYSKNIFLIVLSPLRS